MVSESALRAEGGDAELADLGRQGPNDFFNGLLGTSPQRSILESSGEHLLEDRQWVGYRSFVRSANCADSRRMLTNEGNPLKRTSGTNGDVKPPLAWSRRSRRSSWLVVAPRFGFRGASGAASSTG